MRYLFIMIIPLFIFILPQELAAETLVDQRITGEQTNCDLLDESQSDELIQIAHSLEDKDTAYFIERWNTQVLTSKKDLQNEQLLLSRSSCLPKEDEVGAETKYYLDLYASTLAYFEQLFQEEEDLQVDELSVHKPGKFVTYRLHVTMDDNKEVEVMFFPGFSGDSNYRHMKHEQTKESVGSKKLTDVHYLKATIIDPLFHLLFNNLLGSVFDTVEEHTQDKADQAWDSQLNEWFIPVREFGIEFAIIEGDLGKHNEQMQEIHLYPTTTTYDRLERWKELHEINHDIPYPKEAIEETDWLEIGKNFDQDESTFDDIDFAIDSYIRRGELPDDKTVEDVANGLSGKTHP